jgi:hypothetical protein
MPLSTPPRMDAGSSENVAASKVRFTSLLAQRFPLDGHIEFLAVTAPFPSDIDETSAKCKIASILSSGGSGPLACPPPQKLKPLLLAAKAHSTSHAHTIPCKREENVSRTQGLLWSDCPEKHALANLPRLV